MDNLCNWCTRIHTHRYCLAKIYVVCKPVAMASLQRFGTWAVECSYPSSSNVQTKQVIRPIIPISRRSAILISVLSVDLISTPLQTLARERRNRKVIPLEEYLTSCESIHFFSCSLIILVLNVFFKNFSLAECYLIDWFVVDMLWIDHVVNLVLHFSYALDLLLDSGELYL